MNDEGGQLLGPLPIYIQKQLNDLPPQNVSKSRLINALRKDGSADQYQAIQWFKTQAGEEGVVLEATLIGWIQAARVGMQ